MNDLVSKLSLVSRFQPPHLYTPDLGLLPMTVGGLNNHAAFPPGYVCACSLDTYMYNDIKKIKILLTARGLYR